MPFVGKKVISDEEIEWESVRETDKGESSLEGSLKWLIKTIVNAVHSDQKAFQLKEQLEQLIGGWPVRYKYTDFERMRRTVPDALNCYHMYMYMQSTHEC